MDLWLAADPPFFGGPGQGIRQIVELFVAFGLTALIGLERELQGKSANRIMRLASCEQVPVKRLGRRAPE